jgi:hypothetical protein
MVYTKQIDWQQYYYHHKNGTVQSYLYDPDDLDINQYPCWDTFEEAQKALPEPKSYKLVRPNYSSADVEAKIAETNIGTTAFTKEGKYIGFNHGFYSRGNMLEEDFKIIEK